MPKRLSDARALERVMAATATTDTAALTRLEGLVKGLSPRQAQAWELLHDNEARIVFYGGGAGGGKTWLASLWHIEHRLKYPGTTGVISRQELEQLRKHTMNTVFKVAAAVGLVANRDYWFNSQSGVITWANGSRSLLIALGRQPSDPDYQRLGGLECTDIVVDEAQTIEEAGFDILMSRNRDRHGELGIVEKALLTGNPGPHWLKYRFVQDLDGNAVELRPYQDVNGDWRRDAYVQALVDDNPDSAFARRYKASLDRLPAYDRARLLYGDWDAEPRTGGEFYGSFEAEHHVSDDAKYRHDLPIHLSFDFNVHPYMTCLVAQIEGKTVRVIDEICPTPPNSSTPYTARAVLTKYRGHAAGCFVYGDPAGRAQTTRTEGGFDEYRTIAEVLKDLHPTMRVQHVAPAVKVRGDWLNEIFKSQHQGISIAVARQCRNLIQDLSNVKSAPDGTKLKQKVLSPSGARYEKYGHTSDALDYLMCSAFSADFQAFKGSGVAGQIPVILHDRRRNLI